MIFNIRKIFNILLNLNLFSRRSILVTIDISCFFLAFIVTNWFFNYIKFFNNNFLIFSWILPLSIFIGIPFYFFTGHYKEITRYTKSPLSYKLLRRNLILIFLVIILGNLLNFNVPSLRYFCLFWFLLTTFIGEARLIIKEIVQYLRATNSKKKLVAIYGAGVAGSQLAASLKLDKSMDVKIFFDDDKQLWGRTIEGIPICSFEKISGEDLKVDLVLLAMPTIKNTKRKFIIERLEFLNISVLQIPSIKDVLSRKAKIDDLKPINVEDLLGREKVIPNDKLISSGIKGLSICITGAGGSIGSELCKQIARFKPKNIILIERNEPSLYKINEKLKPLIQTQTSLFSYLGCAQNESFIKKIFKT